MKKKEVSNYIKRGFFLNRLGVKLAIVGSAVYFTVENSIWDKSEYANVAISKVKNSFPDTNELLKNVRKE